MAACAELIMIAMATIVIAAIVSPALQFVPWDDSFRSRLNSALPMLEFVLFTLYRRPCVAMRGVRPPDVVSPASPLTFLNRPPLLRSGDRISDWCRHASVCQRVSIDLASTLI